MYDHIRYSTGDSDIEISSPSRHPLGGGHSKSSRRGGQADQSLQADLHMPPGMGFDLTPKHAINTPIIEETESNLEAEILRSRQSRRDK